MQIFLRDMRYGIRVMLKNKSISLIAIVTLALGIGANTAIFSVVNALLLVSVPAIPASEQLVRLYGSDRSGPYQAVSYMNYADLRDRNRVFSGLAAYQLLSLSMNSDGQPEMVQGALVSGNFFSVLGVQPVLGRTFLAEEDRTPGSHPVAVISYGLWRRRFNSDPGLVGKMLRLNGHNFTIVGVAPRDFIGVDRGFVADVWAPIMMYAQLLPRLTRISETDPLRDRSFSWINGVIGRLQPSVDFEAAQTGLNVIARQLEQAYPETNRETRVTLFPFSEGQPHIRSALVSASSLLLAVVALVLLIACANVANLLLARAAARQKEIAIRVALGAGRGQIIRQILTECVLLSLLSGAAGVLLAVWAVNLILRLKPPVAMPIVIEIGIDWHVLGFTLLVVILTGILFGLPAALQASRPSLVPALKGVAAGFGAGRHRLRLRSLFVVAQVALSFVLLIGAGLFLRSLQHAQTIDLGFDPRHLLLARTDLDFHGYTAAQGQQFYRRLLDRVKAMPGVSSASLTSILPLSFASREADIAIEGKAPPPDGSGLFVGTNTVGPDYFATMGIPLAQGREFGLQDNESALQVIVINETMARRFWPGENPIGRRVRLALSTAQQQPLEVIGVVKDSKSSTLGEQAQPMMYQALLQDFRSKVTLVVRSQSEANQVLTGLRREIRALDENLPVSDAMTMTEHLGLSLFAPRMAARLLIVFGLLGLLLAAIGLYGIMAWSVSQRRREIGVYLALGAQPHNILKLVMGQGMRLALMGIGIGFVVALAVTRLISSLLYGVGATDPLTFGLIALLLTVVALLACYLPARRATKVDPLAALRAD
jgi:macrolide transport system ATP-binding/permease protein